MKTNSITYRRRCPEGTTFTTILFDVETLNPHTLVVNIGKAGSELKAAADWGSRLAGAALRSGAKPDYIAEITEDIRHSRSNGHYEASSLADAVAQSLKEFAKIAENEEETQNGRL